MTGRISDLLSRAADAHGGRPAVVDGERVVDYTELESRAAGVGEALSDAGVMPGDRVGLLLEKSVEAVVGVHGVLRSGAAYVPLDAAAPSARLAYMASDCDIRCLVTAGDQQDRWRELVEHGAPLHTVVVLDEGADPGPRVLSAGNGSGRRASAAAPAPGRDDDLAYVLYTSGSTGRPKGVQLTHGNAMAFIDWAGHELSVEEADRLSSHAPFHFDLSIFDLFVAAAAGAAVVLVPKAAARFPAELARFIADTGITVWYSVPSALAMLALRGGLAPGDLPHLRAVLFAGEVFPTPHLRKLMELVPSARFCNLYGPTETNVCTWYEVLEPPVTDEPIPIGRPIDGVDAFVVGDGPRLLPPGEEGELWVRGPTVMQGYWGDPARTAEVLVDDPFSDRPGLVYRTGDIVRRGDDGELHFRGRRDSQVKSRGHRIELGEVEAALATHPLVVECAALAVPDELVTNRLVAFVAAQGSLDERDLRRHCMQALPPYMVPERIAVLDRLPRTPTDKVDRRTLAEHAAGRG